MKTKNPYLGKIENNLPRILGMFDRDSSSESYGLGDRMFWAWGLTDFGNATFQGFANGMTLLFKSGLWPYESPEKNFIERIDSLFIGVKRLTRPDGSLEEAFPFEGSYCVTALIAFDLLCALDNMKELCEGAKFKDWQDIISPLINFLVCGDETHGIISNHLATAVAALTRWNRIFPTARVADKAEQLLSRILSHQSREGWYLEYEGADPGYQSLCLYYLADVYLQNHDERLLDSLKKAISFLCYFAHPDGSFAGIYGSRCTRFYNPAGIEALASSIPEAAALAEFMRRSIENNLVVSLDSIDAANLSPWFNSYCWAATLYQRNAPISADYLLPSIRTETRRTHFSQAGLLIDQGPTHYSIINTHKGGVVTHFRNKQLITINPGVVIADANGRIASTQTFCPDNDLAVENDRIVVTAGFCAAPRQMPKPFQFFVLRFLCLTVFRWRKLRELGKKIMVKFLITRKKFWPGKNRRIIMTGPELKVIDETQVSSEYSLKNVSRAFVAIHMASQGYWQNQDEERLFDSPV